MLAAPDHTAGSERTVSKNIDNKRGGDQMVLPSPRHSGPTRSPHPALERRIFDAYQEVKRARRDGDYAAICGWMSEVDNLLDRGAELNANAGRCTAD
jgi:hypothetical protein